MPGKKMCVDLPARFPRRSKAKRELCVSKQGEKIPQEIRSIIKDLLRDAHYTKGEIADKCGVSRALVNYYLEKDPELKAAYQSAWMERMQQVEMAMVDRAINGRNEMAAQQASEFLLSHNMRERYDDKAVTPDRLATLPKIIVPIAVPVRTHKADAMPEEEPPIDV